MINCKAIGLAGVIAILEENTVSISAAGVLLEVGEGCRMRVGNTTDFFTLSGLENQVRVNSGAAVSS